MKPAITLIKEAILSRLKAWPGLTDVLGDKIYLNQAEPFEDYEYPFMAIFASSIVPIDNDYHGERDERRLTFQLEIWDMVKSTPVEEGLELLTSEAETALTNLPSVTTYLPDWLKLLDLKWLSSTYDYDIEAESLQVAIVSVFDIEFQISPRIDGELPDFTTAKTEWLARAGEGDLNAEDETEV